MKSIPLLFLTVLLAIGCQTNPPPVTPPGTNTVVSVETVQTAAAVINMSAQIATYWAVGQDPNARAYFEAAIIPLHSFIANGDYDPSTLGIVLNNISVKEVRSPLVRIALNGALEVYRTRWAEAVSRRLDLTVWVKPLLVALERGVRDGLDARLTERRHNLPRRP